MVINLQLPASVSSSGIQLPVNRSARTAASGSWWRARRTASAGPRGRVPQRLIALGLLRTGERVSMAIDLAAANVSAARNRPSGVVGRTASPGESHSSGRSGRPIGSCPERLLDADLGDQLAMCPHSIKPAVENAA